jgi:hypothetical protein
VRVVENEVKGYRQRRFGKYRGGGNGVLRARLRIGEKELEVV